MLDRMLGEPLRVSGVILGIRNCDMACIELTNFHLSHSSRIILSGLSGYVALGVDHPQNGRLERALIELCYPPTSLSPTCQNVYHHPLTDLHSLIDPIALG